jgi:ABC-type polysaccharide/polyol phosphate transport system ATPase subunit
MNEMISLEGVGKRYWKLNERAMLLRSLLPFARPERSELWALRDIDLAIGEGDVVGIIGRNGAGKTTLLRLLAGVTRPTTGRARVRGRVAPLISVGVGFHKEMSGRENVYVNGMLLGLTKAEIDRRFDAIVDFAELANFIDTPVKFYSSGMFMRLGFAVAVHTDPDVLLVDEILAVGDMAFQLKCVERMKQIRAAGTTIVLVSHNLQSIRILCPRALVINHGQLEFDGNVEAAIARHHEIMSTEGRGDNTAVGDYHYAGGAIVRQRVLLGREGPTNFVQPGEELRLRLRVHFEQAVSNPRFGFAVRAQDGTLAYSMHTPIELAYREIAAGQEIEVELRFTARLGGGTYRITDSITTSDALGVIYVDATGIIFEVGHRHGADGVADLTGVIVVDGAEVSDPRSFELGSTTAGPAGLGSSSLAKPRRTMG